MSTVARFAPKVHIKNKLLRNALAEFFGTFLLVFIGEAIVAQLILPPRHNSWIQINVGWGFAVAFAIMVVAKISGGHLNPAVTVMFWTFGAVDIKTVVVYILAQTLGAFVGAAGVYFFYIDAINHFDGGLRAVVGVNATAGIFTTFAPSWLSASGAFVDQAVGTGILCLFIAAIIDPKNNIPGHLHALLFGFVVMMIGCAFGLHIGYPINPARDFGPRLFAALIYGGKVFTHPYPAYFLMPVLGPIVGGVLGGWMYVLFAGAQIPDETLVPDRSDKHKNITLAKPETLGESEKLVE